MPYYYADASRQPVGPLSDDELAAAVAGGSIQASTPVFAEGSSEWSTYGALFPAAQPERPIGPPPPPPPPLRRAAPVVNSYSGAGVDGSARMNEAAQKTAGAFTEGVAATFKSAKTPAEMMVVFGAIAGVVAFFLPWLSGGFGDSVSGFTLMRSTTFLFALQPLLALGAFVIAFLNLAVGMRQRVLRGRWTLLFGAIPAAVLAGMLFGAPGSSGFGMYIAFLAALAVAAGAFMQMGADMSRVG